MRVSQSVVRTLQTLCNASARQQLEQCSKRRCSVQVARKKAVVETPIIGTSLAPTIQPVDPPQQSPFYETPEIIINDETRIQRDETMAARRLEVRSKIREIEERTGKIPLVDSFARVHNYLRISLTETCNFSCSYCMPAGGVDGHSKSDLMTNEEIIVLARVFARRGINKIRLTGGEPTLRKDLHNLIAELKKIDGIDDIGITTNGLILGRQLEQLKAAGLDKINISLDTLIPRRFEQMTKVFGFEKVFKAIDATEAAYGRVKVNVVVIRGFNTDELTSFVHATKDRNWDVRFIEFMPFGGNDFKENKFVGYSEQLEIIKKEFGNQIVRLQDSPNDTSKAYKIVGHRGQFGFISSMSDNFCSTCNRVRLTANGNLKFAFTDESQGLSAQQRRSLPCRHIASRWKREKRRGAYRESVVEKESRTCWHRNAATHGEPADGFDRWITGNWRVPTIDSALSHVDSTGAAHQVDVSEKSLTKRTATAVATIKVSRQIFDAIQQNSLKKGDVLSVANIASIQAAKRTADLIPLCHQIPVAQCETQFRLDETQSCVHIKSVVVTVYGTGVEMEALTAVSIAALTIYDMCKAISHEMSITSIHLQSKSGGKRDFSSTSFTF